ncbi:Nif3-like dinuclear metal center hexameric protein [Methanococcoides orientis]|uniref:Nif3-like dinuclear metal center hexameric protein n=1 Tax=Methanococcoides orientis TaxID=2822137 RepID=UPI001E409AC3|nr:Nif3-like dinuclear metal center hexameric protein [Methanococcoides orientis]UGV41213.1 Nif3-like dinuclear metal center hexameric protein [Methanococcoides orientis]
MELSVIVETLEEIAPPELAEDFDVGRIGLTLDLDNDVNRIAVALDPTEYVLKRAAQIGADLLITHHTLIFHSVNLISKELAGLLKIALDNGISLYSMHTNYDRAEGGVNDVLARRLGLGDVKDVGMGRIGRIDDCSVDVFVNHVSKSLNTHLQYVGEKDSIRNVMVFGGSGFKDDFLDIAREHNVDAYVSAELKHDVLRNYDDILLVDATHYATENPAMESLCERLKNMLNIDVEFIDNDPFIGVL